MIGTEDSGIESQINYKLLYINKKKWKQKRKLWVAARCAAATW